MQNGPLRHHTKLQGMKKGFLLGGSASRAVTTMAAVASSSRAPLEPVANILHAQLVSKQKAAGAARVVRVECDFVTCSQ